jgi:hypothetical protein
MNKPLIPIIYLLLIVMLTGWLGACSKQATPESRIIALIEEGELAAEDRNLGFFRDVIAQDYIDAKGLSRDAFLRMLAGYFYRNRTIHLISRTEDVVVEDSESARAVIIVGMAGSPVEGFDQLLTLRADLYRLELEFHMAEDIQLRYARWERIAPEALFLVPED